MIGTGIFVVIGEGIGKAGPAVILSFALAGLTCLFSALSYAELSSAIPVSGSAYTYAYATLGELVAWIIGWDLILEYGVSVAAVAVGWGGNLNEFLENAFGYALPTSISTAREDGGILNLPAVAIVVAVMFLLSRGVRETARANLVMVGVKLVILAFFIVVAFVAAFSADNLKPFAPQGVDGVVSRRRGDLLRLHRLRRGLDRRRGGQEPKRDLPIAIIGSLVICTIIYILVSVAAVGSLDAKALAESDAPLAEVLDEGAGISWAASLLAFGALVAITSVLLTVFYGQTRIFFAMARDGLMPRGIAKVNPRTGTPVALTLRHGHRDRDPGRDRAAERDRQAGQHRHAVRVLPREHRRDHPAPHAPGHGAAVPGAVRAGVPDHRLRPDPLPDDARCRARPGGGSSSGSSIGLPSTTSTAASTRCCRSPAGRVSEHDHRRRPRRLGLRRRRRDARRAAARRRPARACSSSASTPRRTRSASAASTPSGWRTCASTRRRSARRAKRFLAGRGVEAEYRVVGSGSAAHGLDDVAEAEGASMIVVGSSRRGARRRISPGSTGERLLHGAICPVAVAPRGLRERPGGRAGQADRRGLRRHARGARGAERRGGAGAERRRRR